MKNISFLLALGICFLMVSCNKHIKVTTPAVPPPGDSTPTHHDSTTTTPPVSHDSLYAWQKITFGYNLADIWFISASTGFLSGGNSQIAELFESSDSGKTWAAIPGTQSKGMNNLYFYNSQYGFAQGFTQLQITSDGGNTWRLKSTITQQGLNFQFISPSTGYYTDIVEGLYKTTDTGNNWNPVLQGNNSASGFYTYFIDSLTGYTIDGYGDIYSTDNQGVTWQQFSTNLPALQSGQGDFDELQFLDSLNGFYACPKGVFKTTNAGTVWTNIFNNGGRLNILKFLGADTGYYKSDSAIYKTVDGGINWTTSLKVSGDEITGMHFINGSTGWACTVNGLILRLNP
jgi:photosystem II stability/assembly factor-like uncharacterized protein